MDIIQILFLVPLCVFYIIYLTKMLALKHQNIQGNILGKGDKPKDARVIEIALKAITYIGAVIQFISVLFHGLILSFPMPVTARITGIIFGVAGSLFLLLSVTAMKTNWRAGYNASQNTELVTNGIYRISRNPAFAGFDLLYIGCALSFTNVVIIVITIVAIALFHVQILGEEKYLATEFGESYKQYRTRVCRYIGKKNIISK